MTTLDQIKKHYNKLTILERYPLIVSAAARDDEAERRALMQAAPRKSWSMPDYYGLSEGFEFVSAWYMMNQLGYIASIHFMMNNSDGRNGEKVYNVVIEKQEIKIDVNEYLNTAFKRVLINLAAWTRLCKEYKVDPHVMLRDLPHYDFMQWMIATIDASAGMVGEETLPTEAEITKEFEEMQAVIEKLYNDWK
jgi:hypothetical protein